MPRRTPLDVRLEPSLARLVESGLCKAKDPKKYQTELATFIKRTSGSKDLESQASFFKALADETRLRMVYALLSREMCECEVTAALGLTQPTASHHLSILQRAHIIQRTRQGKWVFYKASSVPTKSILHGFGNFQADARSTGPSPTKEKMSSSRP